VVVVVKASARSVCPLCGAGGQHVFEAWDSRNPANTARFDYHRCGECGSTYLPEIPEDLGSYYPPEYYFRPDGASWWRLDPNWMAAEQYRMEAIRRAVSPGVLIELGAGSGTFAEVAKAAGFDVTALEMDSASCAYIEERVGVRVIRTEHQLEALDTLPQARVICAWHVLEHLPNPGETLARLAEQLEPGGILGLGVPNPASLQFRLLGRHWVHLDAPRHLCLIPPDALIAQGRVHGLEPLLVATNDPFCTGCNRLGWTVALRSPRAGDVMTRIAAPIERRGTNGAALLVLLRRSDYHQEP
jgi:SAM-dependent methyltransferase